MWTPSEEHLSMDWTFLTPLAIGVAWITGLFTV